MKESFYFSHDSNARSDEKMIKLRSRHGAMGYGIFFMLIEMLREAKDYQLLVDYKAIAYEIREDKEVIKDVVENYELFDILLDKQNDFARKFFTSQSLTTRMSERDKIRKKRQEAGKKGGLAKATVLLKQKSSKVLAGKERKGKEKKGKENREREDSPAGKMNSFISSVLEKDNSYMDLIKAISRKTNLQDNKISAELDKFVSYWCELNKSGTKQRWQLQSTFEVQKRLTTWFSRASNGMGTGKARTGSII